MNSDSVSPGSNPGSPAIVSLENQGVSRSDKSDKPEQPAYIGRTKPGTDLFHRTIAYDYGDEDRRALMEKVWSPTPYMVDAWTGSGGEDRDREMLLWCYDTFGEQAFPIHGRVGDWQRGSATVFGWTWYGFSAPELLSQFLDRWEDEEWPASPTPVERTER